MALRKSEEPIPELGNRTWTELELVEDEQGRILFKDQIRQRGKDGWKAVPVRVRVPRTPDLLKARRDARALVTAEKLDEVKDKDLFLGIEQACIVAVCLRTAEAPHGQFLDAQDLLADFDESGVVDVLARINHYKELVNPRPPVDLTEEQVFDLVLALRRHGNLGPLVDIAGDAQPSFIMRMAELAWSCPTVQSYARSLVTSTPVESPPETSSAS